MSNPWDLNDLTDLPEEVLKEIKVNDKPSVIEAIGSLLDEARTPLTYNQLVAALYRRWKLQVPRDQLRARLSDLCDKGVVSKCGDGVVIVREFDRSKISFGWAAEDIKGGDPVKIGENCIVRPDKPE